MTINTVPFTATQIQEQLSEVRTGADFPLLAKNLKGIGVTYYETRMKEGCSIYHGEGGYELRTGPVYEPIIVADKLNIPQLKADISRHQQGKSGYSEISRQSAENGIAKWAVCLTSMTCTYIDKAGNKAWVEQIPVPQEPAAPFTLASVSEAHGRVKSGADFPGYIREIKQAGVTRYDSYVTDGHIDYFGNNNYKVAVPPKYKSLTVAETCDQKTFKADLASHQQGKTTFPAFCNDCAKSGVERWSVDIIKMTCTYYDRAGNAVLVEQIPE